MRSQALLHLFRKNVIYISRCLDPKPELMCCRRSIPLLIIALLSARISYAQFSVPWSSTVNVTFGRSGVNPGPPLPTGYTEFTYTTDPCPVLIR